jgi:hypothetical protein
VCRCRLEAVKAGHGDLLVIREVISSLSVWHADVRDRILLPPGTILTGCRIRRHDNPGGEDGVEAYAMEFESGGQRYACPLFLFQPRTRPVEVPALAAAGF